MYQAAAFILTFLAVVALGHGLTGALTYRKRRLSRRLMDDFDLPQVAKPADKPARPLAASLANVGRLAGSSTASAKLRESLARAGMHGDSAASVYIGAKVVMLVLGLLAAPLLLALEVSPRWTVFGTLLTMGTLSFLPNIIVGIKRDRRRQNVHNHLPDAVDLLEICVSSGMGLDMAWNVVSDEIRPVSTILGDEMALTNLEMNLGAQRVDAMKHLAQRTAVQEIGSLVAVLVQSERFGTSIADALRSFASSMREYRSLRAQESAEKMAVRLLFPMVLLIFPALLIVLAGPAGMTIAKMIAD